MAQGALIRGAAAVVIAAAGVLAEIRGGSDDIAFAVLDWSVGAAFAVTAVWRGGRLGLLTAGTWYLGTLAGATGWPGTIGTAVVLTYRAPTLHLLLRPAGTPALAIALAGYPAVLLSAWLANPITIVLAVLGATATAGSMRRLSSDRRGWAAVRVVLGLLVATVWAGSTFHVPAEARLVALHSVMIAIAVSTVTARRATMAAATDLLVDLGPARRAPAPVSAVVGKALGAPQLAVRYRTHGGEWLNELALPAPAPPAGALTAPTPDGGEVAIVGCPPDLADSELGRAAARGAALAVADTLALAAVRRGAAEVDASRRRLAEVSDSERRQLGYRVRAGPMAQLAHVRTLLGEIDAPGVDVAAVHTELDSVTAELARLAEGLYPASALDDPVAMQLHTLAATLSPPASVRVSGTADALPAQLRVIVHFVVAECMTNTARHAPTCAAEIELSVTDVAMSLRVVDSGPGGANMRPGGGIEGLADRVALLDGVLQLTSPPGGPTELRIDVPLP